MRVSPRRRSRTANSTGRRKRVCGCEPAAAAAGLNCISLTRLLRDDDKTTKSAPENKITIITKKNGKRHARRPLKSADSPARFFTGNRLTAAMAQRPNERYLSDEERAELQKLINKSARAERKRKPASGGAAAGDGKRTRTDARDIMPPPASSGVKSARRNGPAAVNGTGLRRQQQQQQPPKNLKNLNEEIQRRFRNLTDFIGEQLKARKPTKFKPSKQRLD